MDKVKAFVNGQPITIKTVQETRYEPRPLFRHFPRWIVALLNRLGITTTQPRQVTINMLEDVPPVGQSVVVMYQVDFGED